MTLRVLDLFSGIGGFSLGLERTGGFKTVAFCEIDPFCRRVLAKHWPEVKQYEDVRTLDAPTLRRDGIAVDVICGGFPCQDVSHAGKRAGLEGARSGLWSEYARLIGELRPSYVIVENVPGLLSLGMGAVLGELAAIGYDACWDCVPAGSIGAPHIRDRVWIIAKPRHSNADNAGPHRASIDFAREAEFRDEQEREPGSVREDVADTASARRSARQSSARGPARNEARRARSERLRSDGGDVADANVEGLEVVLAGEARQRAPSLRESPWSFEPDVGRVAYGVPSRVDRLRSLGNAVVPQIPELIGNAILQSMCLKAVEADTINEGVTNAND